jgi:hypothetical protein
MVERVAKQHTTVFKNIVNLSLLFSANELVTRHVLILL